ncbi:MAG: hypothetical protein ACRDO1_06685 [Nocardioidaceae bacterium]
MRRLRVYGVALLVTAIAMLWAGTANAAQADADTLTIELDRTEMAASPGEKFTFESTIRNDGDQPLTDPIAHLNILGADEQIYVDPEDWSTRRTQFLDELPPGETTTLRWTVTAIDSGALILYVAVSGTESDAVAVSGPLQMSVGGRRVVNPGNVVPLVMATPVGVLALLGLALVRRQRLR